MFQAIISALHSLLYLVFTADQEGMCCHPYFVKEGPEAQKSKIICEMWLENGDPNLSGFKSDFFLVVLLLLPLSEPPVNRNNYIYLFVDE